MSVDAPTAARWWQPALAAVAAVVAALGAGELAAAIVDLRASPLVAVDGVVVDRVPESAKALAIRLFGTNDKVALQAGTIVLLILIAGGLGVAARSRRWLGPTLFGVLGALAIAAALTRAGASVAWALPGLVAAGVGAGLLAWLPRIGEGEAYLRTEPAWQEASRRRFLRISGLALAGGALGGFAARFASRLSSVEDSRAQVAAELPTPSGGPAPAVPGSDVAELRYVTPNATFYRIDTALVTPRIDPAGWSLTIDGRVGKPLRLTFDELLARPMVERYITLACVSNFVGGDLIGNAVWLGVPIADLLDEVDPDPAADQVVSRSVDGFSAGTPTAALRDGRDALLAIAMNGEPLPVDHGFPVRMVVPGLYGYVSATKWLVDLELTRFDRETPYWVERGWVPRAPIRTASRIDTPRSFTDLRSGRVAVAGVAWAQHRGIAKVEVRVDGGSWAQARLAEVPSADTWRQWVWEWAATPGRHVLEVRATDADGVTQPGRQRMPFPSGATGWHAVEVSVS
jgi:DMSO/TMAO reductase YedYZ molybdopterin-dependent catalytic subunit